MKKITILPLLASFALLCSCNPYHEHVLKGTLYSDSTLTTPLAGDTLTFHDGEDLYDCDNYLGQAVTDQRGRWAFQYVTNLESPNAARTGAKFSMAEYWLVIVCGDDTLYAGDGWDATRTNKTFYPGCWTDPFRRHNTEPDTTQVADSTRNAGN